MTSLRQSASKAITTSEQRKGAKLTTVGEDEGHGSDAPKNNTSSRRTRRKFRSRLDARQQKFAALTIVILTIIILTAMVTSPYHTIVPSLKTTKSKSQHHDRDSSQPYLKDRPTRKKKKRVDLDNCAVVEAVLSTQPVTTTFTASFPGSGARVTWQLVEALTGLKTGDDLTANGKSNVVSIKTHYPSREGRLIPGSELVPHAMLLIRHPLYVLPTYFRLLYRYETKSPNVKYPPIDKWIEWRNNYFDRHLQVWRRHTEYWMDHYKKADRIVITYEKLVDEEYGADEALRVAEFLDRSEGVMSFPPEDVPCAWHQVVKPKKNVYRIPRRLQEAEVTDKLDETDVGVVQNEVGQDPNGDVTIKSKPLDAGAAEVEVKTEAQQDNVPVEAVVGKSGGEGTVARTKLKTQTQPQGKAVIPEVSITKEVQEEVKYDPPYNKQQLKDMIQILTQLLERYRDDHGLAPVLVAYIDEVAKRSHG